MYTDPRRTLSYQTLIWWTTLGFLTSWLPLVRGVMDGPSYQWGTSWFGLQFAGRGIDGDFPYLIARALLGIALIYFAWHRPTLFTRRALALWTAVTAADITFAAIQNPAGFRFQGDTLGIDVSLTWAAPILSVAFAAIAIRWASRSVPPLPVFVLFDVDRAATRRFGIAVALLPAQWTLLHSGKGMDWHDMVGVVLTIAQWWLLCASFSTARRVRNLPGADAVAS